MPGDGAARDYLGPGFCDSSVECLENSSGMSVSAYKGDPAEEIMNPNPAAHPSTSFVMCVMLRLHVANM